MDVLLVGDGLNEPMGIMHETGGGQVGIVTKASEGVSYDEITKLYFSLDEEYRKNAVFLMNDTTAMHLRQIKDEAGRPLWYDNNDTIFAKPVLTSPYMPSMAAGAKAIAFGDLSFYWLVERQPLTTQRLQEIYVLESQIAFLGYERVDGRLIRPEAVKILQMKA